MTEDKAETIALMALAWIIGDDELLPVFQGATGAMADDFRARASEAEFQISTLDFLMMQDSWVISFCDAKGLGYDSVMEARQSLPGGAEMHWT